MTEQSHQNAPVAETVKPKKRRCKKIACISSAVLGIPLLATTGALVAGLTTESGNQALFKLAQKFVPELKIGEMQGALASGLTLSNLTFQTDGVETYVAKTHAKLDFHCLLQRKICLQDLMLEQPSIQIDASKLTPSEPTDEQSEPMHKIDLPIGIEISNVSVANLSLAIDQNYIDLAQFQTSLNLTNAQGLVVAPTDINGLRITQIETPEQKLARQKEAEQAEKTAKPLDWVQLEQSLTPALLGNLTAVTLPFDMQVQNLRAKDWHYQQFNLNSSQTAVKISPEFLLNAISNSTLAQYATQTQNISVSDITIQAQSQGNVTQLQQFTLHSSLGNISASGQLQLDNQFPLNLSLDADIQAIEQQKQLVLPATQVHLNVSGALKEITYLNLSTQGGLNANLTGDVALNQEKMPFKLHLTSDKVSYPFDSQDKTQQLTVNNVDLNITGNLLDYHLNLSAQAQGMGAPKIQLNAQASGGISHANLSQLQLATLDGKLNLTGNVDWQKGVQWQSQAQLNQINLGAYLPNLPAVLSGGLSTNGYANGKDWQVAVPELDLHGTLAKQPLNLQGNLTAGSQQLVNVPQLLLNYGANHIRAHGQISQKSDFALDINAPDLRGLVPELSASLTGQVHLNGDISAPNLDLNLVGKQIAFQQMQIGQFVAQGKITTQDQIQGNVDVTLDRFRQNELQISKATLTASGNEKSHQLQFRADGEPVAASLNLAGAFDRNAQKWSGTLSQVNIKSLIGMTNNDKAIGIVYDNTKQQAQVSAHCWHNSDIDLCLPQNFTVGANGEVLFELKRLNLDLVNRLTKQQDLLKGVLRSQGKVAWFSDKPVKLDVQVNGENMAVAQKVDIRTFRLGIPKLAVNAQLENNNLAVKSDINLDRGQINTDLKIADIAKGRKLGGNLVIQGVNLDLANQLLSNSENVSGEVQTHLNFAGDLNAPLLNGALNISRLQAKSKSLPIQIVGGELGLNFYGNRSTLTGNIQTPESRLNLDGDANWQSLERWAARVHAKADNFYVEVPSMAKLKVSPDVTVKASPSLIDLSGEILIPWARIAIESLPDSAVAVSSDEVILTPQSKRETAKALPTKMAATTSSGIPIHSDLKIKIGDDVTVSAYDLNSELNGLLNVKQEKGQLGLYGQINLKNGRYASFGQDLLIRKGQISFSGLPSEPMLNIEAIRNPETMEDSTVTAGVKVTGLSDSPSVQVFSTPNMSQDQALSYILTGRSLENSGEAGSSGSVGAALLGMGLAKSGKAVGKVGEAFGIQDLNLGTAGVGDSSKVVVSGNITPRLKIKYGVGLFDGLAEVTLRYKLLPQLYLQSVSGVNQAFDLLYQFEW